MPLNRPCSAEAPSLQVALFRTALCIALMSAPTSTHALERDTPINHDEIGDWTTYQYKFSDNLFIAANEGHYPNRSLTVTFDLHGSCQPSLHITSERRLYGSEGYSGKGITRYKTDSKRTIEAIGQTSYLTYRQLNPSDKWAHDGGSFTVSFASGNLPKVLRQMSEGNEITITYINGSKVKNDIEAVRFGLSGAAEAIHRAQRNCSLARAGAHLFANTGAR